ncbi:MAG: S8 family peptidase [Wenzhouxiangella sp.]
MAEKGPEKKPHFIIRGTALAEPYTYQGRGGSEVPRQNRQTHGQGLLRQIDALKPAAEQAKAEQQEAGLEEGFGLQIEFESFPDIELAFESLAAEGSGIELQNVRHDEGKTLATVFVPDGKLLVLENKIAAYLDQSKDTAKGTPKNQKLLDAIRSIRKASIHSLWTDTPSAFPRNSDEPFWWEVWLPIRDDRETTVARFRELATNLEFRVGSGTIEFPERTVLLVHGTMRQMGRSILALNCVAELRRAKETADFFDSLLPEEQPEWVDELLQRMTLPEADGAESYVCILDTGINEGHPLLQPAIAPEDLHTVEPGWGTNDKDGHGTEMAGLALLGDLTVVLESNEPIEIRHRLESVKLLDQNHSNGDDSEHHGYLTIQAVNRPAVTDANRRRVFSMAITTDDSRDRGRPSSWSATIDRLAFGDKDYHDTPKLFVVSAGNVEEPNEWTSYPESNQRAAIQDPGQAWNALTVGACTKLVQITEPDTDGYKPIAPLGGLSPFSTTSLGWESHWPLKPDVVFEGGNAAKDEIGAAWMHSLCLLTTSSEINTRLFTTTNGTSAATALAARMAARLIAEYPDLRLETIRALMVHSAEWTPEMRKQFLEHSENPKKAEVTRLVRHCGFGQPDLSRALWSVKNSLTLICEDSLQPFIKEEKNEPKLREMNLHLLPWPLEALEELGETEVEMRVTLSYFVEPSPSARGIKSRYRYESHGLRFDARRPHESNDDFRRRINLAARDEDIAFQSDNSNDPNWLLGIRERHKGSIHSDIWRGSAVELARRGVLAVYPVSGWWKTRKKLGRYHQRSDYSLLVSIRAPELDVELYSAIESQIQTPIQV